MSVRRKSEPNIILYVRVEPEKTDVYRVSEKGALKLARKPLKSKAKEKV